MSSFKDRQNLLWKKAMRRLMNDTNKFVVKNEELKQYHRNARYLSVILRIEEMIISVLKRPMWISLRQANSLMFKTLAISRRRRDIWGYQDGGWLLMQIYWLCIVTSVRRYWSGTHCFPDWNLTNAQRLPVGFCMIIYCNICPTGISFQKRNFSVPDISHNA